MAKSFVGVGKFGKNPVSGMWRETGFLAKYFVGVGKFGKNPVSGMWRETGFLRNYSSESVNLVKTRFLE
ncbi:hypothetical protein QUB64_27805 [Microcoleus sp. Aus8_D2]|uniref:hypothetical protein n=1 Tax=Microcoleus sp. Aus8_D1 TaxID=3055302 RepID=UPI002FD1D5A7